MSSGARGRLGRDEAMIQREATAATAATAAVGVELEIIALRGHGTVPVSG